MGTHDFDPQRAIEALYESGPFEDGDLAFRTIAEHCRPAGDTELADLVELDGRYRIRTSRPTGLDRYLIAIPDLTSRLEPLDAAIDMALRSLAGSGAAGEDAVADLISRHPELATAIREAAALNEAVWSTSRLVSKPSLVEPKPVPSEFGPRTEDGRSRYELREELGSGAFGRVYLAVDRRLSEADHAALVAVKIVAPADLGSESTFSGEATKARRIAHPNVASVIDCGLSDDGEAFIVYEHLAGGDLARWHREHAASMSLDDMVRMTAKIARGVHAAHMAALVHCDLKPNNVLLTEAGEPKVCDFGIAVRATEADKSRDERRAPRGNLAFMSPEQFRMEPGALTIPTDVYALGGLLFWLVTRQLPNGSTPADVGRTHDERLGRSEAPSIRDHRRVDRDLDAICARALSPKPEDRYGSAAEFARDLDDWIGRRPIAWRRCPPTRRVVLWARRHPVTAAVTGVTALSLAVAIPLALSAYTDARARDEAVATFESYITDLGGMVESGLGESVLGPLWAVEWMFGPTVLDAGADKRAVFETRLEIVNKLVEDRHAAGHDGDLLTTLWETSAAFWLLKDGDDDRAAARMDETILKWERLLDPEDPWMRDMRALHACCHVHGLDRGGGADAARTLAGAIEPSEERLAHEAQVSPLQILFLEKLCILYGPGLLDTPERAGVLRARLAEAREQIY